MALRRFRPLTPGQRHKVANDNSDITKGTPEKSLLIPHKRSGGRNRTGKMTMRYIGGGHKKRIRIIDFKRDKHNIAATVVGIEYDPMRTSRIALLQYKDGEKRYILAPQGLTDGQTVMSGKDIAPNIGNAMPLSGIPLGTIVHNVELNPGQGGKFIRSAGSYAQLTAKEGKFAVLKMPSGETRMVLAACMATVGSVSNADHILEVHGKAGRIRWFGRRPRNRAVAMNPVDHPMGGGEGRASGGHPRSRTGKKSKGVKTRNRTKASNRYIIERRSKGYGHK
ncbi:MAG TPA: 50S ribosomal protein L2 [Bacteroidia bacterium]